MALIDHQPQMLFGTSNFDRQNDHKQHGGTRKSGHGKTIGGLRLYPAENRFDREEALRLYTVGSSWFSTDENQKGTLAPGQLADLAVLLGDYFSIPEEEIKNLESDLTIVGGKIVHAQSAFSRLAPPDLSVSPDWSPVAKYGG